MLPGGPIQRRLSAWARRNGALMLELRRVFEENFGVYGERKVWRPLGRKGHNVARGTVARLMQTLGLQGVTRGKPVRTKIGDKTAPCPRQCSGRDHQRTLQGRGHSSTRAMAVVRSRRICQPGIGRLVQKSPADGADRQHRQPRPKSATMPFSMSTNWQRDSNQRASGKPAAVQEHDLVALISLGCRLIMPEPKSYGSELCHGKVV